MIRQRQTVGVLEEEALEDSGEKIIARDTNAILRQASTNPPLRAIVNAKGPFLYAADGQRIIDAHGSNCHHVGYSHPRLVAAIRDQMDELCFVPRTLTNPSIVEAAERLTSLWPYGRASACFVPGGSAAVEAALLIARVHTGRYKTISFYGAYHGRSVGALSLSGRVSDRTHEFGPLLPGAIHVPAYYSGPSGYPVASSDIEQAARLSINVLQQCMEGDGEIAALFAEPVRAAPFLPPAWYWPAVRDLCDRYDVLLVADEVPCGLGKTGYLFASQRFDYAPDITILGKALGGAMVPAAAVIISEKLNTTQDYNLGYFTYERSPILGVAAKTVVDLVIEDRLAENAESLGAFAVSRLEDVAGRHPVISEVRGAGLMIGLSFDQKDHGRAINRALSNECLKRGLLPIFNVWSGLTLSFPLIMDEPLIAESIDIFESALKAVLKR